MYRMLYKKLESTGNVYALHSSYHSKPGSSAVIIGEKLKGRFLLIKQGGREFYIPTHMLYYYFKQVG